MPMDESNKRLVNGAIWLAVIAGIALFLPSYGYLDRSKEEDRIRDTLKNEIKKQYDRSHAPLRPVVYGDNTGGSNEPVTGMLLSTSRKQYTDANKDTQEDIDKLEGQCRVAFPAWTEVPEDVREGGVYFQQTWERHKYNLENKWRMAKVECMDPTIGFDFSRQKGLVDNKKAPENLRELYIAEKIISLCIEAKQEQEKYERDRGFQPDTYMKIVAVKPQDSAPTGPSYLVRNPLYSKTEAQKNPMSDKAREYNIVFMRNFIQEYPVEIVLQCDINSFMRFLHRVRTPGQFLAIRNLEIVSPFMRESLADKHELDDLENMLGGDSIKQGIVKDEHVMVKISAAGMDFFDPVKYPNGIYSGAVENKVPVHKSRFKMGM